MAKKLRTGFSFLALALTLGVGGTEAWAARGLEPRTMEGRVFESGLDGEQRHEQLTPRRVNPLGPIAYEIRLEPFVEAQALEKSTPVKGIGAPLQIGTHRNLPASLQAEMVARDLHWEPARNGGEVAAFSLTSPGAKALRVALEIQRLPRGAELRFYSPSEPVAQGGRFDAGFLISQRKARAESEPIWSPVTLGETMVIEVWVPGWHRADDVRLSVRQLSHIYRSLDGKDLRHVGRSGSCNRDVACFKKWTTAAEAVAKIIFEAGGSSALCTGQLMANPKGKFLFLTAAHCINTRGQAGSATFFWKFQRSSCGGANPTSTVQTGGGAKLLFTSRSNVAGLVTDHTLMQLKRDPTALAGSLPGLGWSVSADPEDRVRSKVHGIHHPAGDLKKGSRGKVQDVWQLQSNGSLLGVDPSTHYQVGWNKGTTEGGSSGSAIMSGRRWPSQFVIGVLTGGLASCQERREPDFYGIFDETFRRFKKFRKHFEE